MRILDLDLQRYGPFTGERLVFRPDARVHIVYGPNEAGKSCALAAVTDLLFGIARATRYDFLHDAKEMRIGATVAKADGTRLAFRRRKNKPILTAGDEAALPDDVLSGFLGGLTREVFCRAFALDALALRQSGEELRKSDGELGASLFAAASGLRGFQALRTTIEKDADGIFAPRASKDRRFYQAVERFEEARKAVRDLELSAGTWKGLNETIAAASQKLGELAEQRATNAAGQARLSRLRRAAPILRAIDNDAAALEQLGALPDAPPGFGQALRDAQDDLKSARAKFEKATATQARLAAEHAEIAVDPALLDAADEIERLFALTGQYAKNRSDLPRVEGELREFAAQQAALAARLGMADEDTLATERPSDAAQARVRELAEQGRRLDLDLNARRAEMHDERVALDALQREREERGHLVDPRQPAEKFAALSPVLARLAHRDATASAIAAEARALDDAAARLNPPVRDLDAVASVPLPSPGTVAQAKTGLDTLRDDMRRQRDLVENARSRIEDIERRLDDLAAAGPVLTADRLAAVRAARDTAWQAVRPALFGAFEAPVGVALTDAVSRFEHLGIEADRLADAVAADAERVANHASETRRLAAERKAQAAAQTLRDALEAQHRAALAAWEAEWTASGIPPRGPADMAAWLVALANLLERREALASRRDGVITLDAEAAAIAPILRELGDEIDLPPMPGLDASLAGQRIEAQLKAVAKAWHDARDLELRLRATAARLTSIEAAEREKAAALDAWRGLWGDAAPRIGLGTTATAAEAAAALDVWKDVPAVLRERENRTHRVAGMRRDNAAFEAEALALVVAHAGNLAAQPPDAAIRTLRQSLSEMQGAQARQQEKAKERTRAQGDVSAAGRAVADTELALGGLASRIGATAGDDLAGLAVGLLERDRILGVLRARREELANAADGHDEPALRAAMVGFDPDAAEAQLSRLRHDAERLTAEGQAAFAEQDRNARELKDKEHGVGAEVALQQRRNAEAEITQAARDYAVLKIGALLIETALERQRVGRQDPLMTRAGALFATLTGAAFDGLAQEFDDDGLPHLAGRRPSGKTIGVDDMSEGTRDQLYLALRLAYLEDYAARAEPAPFIGDDLFASFDDERTGHGLATLAAIGRSVQPILFTHHGHVLEIARRTLGDAADIIVLGKTMPAMRAPA